ncbi:hypothetical protein [Streptococcus sp. zg-JUN1979]|uniref:SLAC1 family transporter n=1 Tax=Streptococcus sp. zg-JUN1979 TaxID=3391450 RepID=UPI0039A5958B
MRDVRGQKVYLERLPLGFSGLVLATLALGRLLDRVSPVLHLGLLVIGGLALFFFIVKLLLTPQATLKQLENPVQASSFAPFFMGLLLFIADLPLPKALGLGLWYLVALAFLLYLPFFTKRFVFERWDLQAVYPTWFIVYIGVSMIAISGSQWEDYLLGRWVLLLASSLYPIMIGLVFWRLRKHGIEEAKKPLLAAIAAPTAILLTGYLSLPEAPNPYMLYPFLILSQLIYAYVLGLLIHLSRRLRSLYYTVFSFPLVSTNTALSLALERTKIGQYPFVSWLNAVEMLVTSLAVLYIWYVVLGELASQK